MDNFFEIKYCNDGVIIKKNGISFSVEKGSDGDIWFNSLDSNIELPISYYSRNQDEFQSYIIFEYFMKLIVGRYLLSGDSEDEYGFLPKDLIKSMLPLIMVIPRQMIIDNITYKINDNDEVFNVINNIYNEFKTNQQKIYKFDKKLQRISIFTKLSHKYHNWIVTCVLEVERSINT